MIDRRGPQAGNRPLVAMLYALSATALLAGGHTVPALAGGRQTEGTVRVEGRLTGEGVECQALRAEDGTLYTLVGDLGDFAPGDEVRITATRADFSFCMQGETLHVHRISRKNG